MRHTDIAGTPCEGRMGLGNNKQSNGRLQSHMNAGPWFNKKSEIWKKSPERQKAVQMGKQESWTRWTNPERSLSWADIWQYEPLRLLLRYVYDVLPSPVNICQWNLTYNPNCRLCEKRGTLDHILSSCRMTLSQRR